MYDACGYYAELELSPGASLDEVRRAYRRLAKECHPDTGNVSDGGARFHRLTEAYNALTDIAFKASYDQDESHGAETRSAEVPEPIEPVKCDVCGSVTAQARRLVFWRVTSFILGSHKAPVQKIFCKSCAAREQLKSTLWTSLLGWWGIPWGPLWSVACGFRNATGGSRETTVDEALMSQNAVAFAMRGQGAIAIALGNVLRKSDDPIVARRAAEIIRFFTDRGLDPSTTLKDVWKRSAARTSAMLAIAFAVPLAAATLVMWDSGTAAQSAFSSNATDSGSVDAFDATFGPSAPETIATENLIVAPQAEPEPPATCASSPSNGEILTDNRGAAESGHRLEIDNGTQGDAIIKMREAATSKTLVAFFVARGQSASLGNIPDGSYTIQYATGDQLAEDCRTFLNNGNASASEFPGPETLTTRYEEELDGVRIMRSRLSYTLYPVPYGNVQPSGISMDEFDG